MSVWRNWAVAGIPPIAMSPATAEGKLATFTVWGLLRVLLNNE